MKSEALTHGQVLVAKPLPWELIPVLGSASGQRWAKGGDLIKSRVTVMLLPAVQLLTFMSTTDLDLQVVGVHCKGGTGRSDYSNKRFFAKKLPMMANMDVFASKGFL